MEDKLKKASAEEAKTKKAYEDSLTSLSDVTPRYVEEMTQVTGICFSARTPLTLHTHNCDAGAFRCGISSGRDLSAFLFSRSSTRRRPSSASASSSSSSRRFKCRRSSMSPPNPSACLFVFVKAAMGKLSCGEGGGLIAQAPLQIW